MSSWRANLGLRGWNRGLPRRLVSPALASRSLKLAALATLAGAFSGLFGVGGGTIIVPLLIMLFAYEEREATGTSLAAILVIASIAAAIQAAYGNVDVVKGLAIGVPAVGGVVAGATFQQRIPQRAVSLIFAAMLVAVAAELLIR